MINLIGLKKMKIEDLPDSEILARTIYGEARNQGVRGMAAVAMVILNRLHHHSRRYGGVIHNVCLAPWQFSCWNEDDPNRKKLMVDKIDNRAMARCRVIAALAVDDMLNDPTDGATHYHWSKMKVFPYWSESRFMTKLAEIGDHIFYREV